MLLIGHKLDIPVYEREAFKDTPLGKTQVPCLIIAHDSFMLESLDICKFLVPSFNTQPPTIAPIVQSIAASCQHGLDIQTYASNMSSLEANIRKGDLWYDIFVWPFLRRIWVVAVNQQDFPKISDYVNYCIETYEKPISTMVRPC